MTKEYHLIDGEIIAVSYQFLSIEQKKEENEIRKLFNSKYYGQWVGCDVDGGTELPRYKMVGSHIEIAVEWLLLRSVEQLTDNEIRIIAQLAHQKPKSFFHIKRDDDIIHATNEVDNGITYHISLYKNYGTVCANIHFSESEKDKFKSFSINIGEVSFSANRPIPYIAIVDYLRSLGIILQFTYLLNNKAFTLSIKDILKLGWAKIKKDE